MKRRIIALCVSLLLSAITLSIGATTTIAWDPNPPAEQVTGYTLFWGPVSQSDPAFVSYPNNMPVTVGTEYTFPDNTFAPGTITYFALDAFNASGLHSDLSNEVSLDLTGPDYVPPTPPTLVSVIATRNPDGTITVVVQ